MPKMLDLTCANCGAEVSDLFVMKVPSAIVHMECGGAMEQVYRPLKRSGAQWSDKDAIVVFKDKKGKYRYPGRNDAPTPNGYERVEMRSLRDVERFEKQAGVRSEIAWYDKGSGHSADEATPGPRPLESESKRFERFRRATQGIL